MIHFNRRRTRLVLIIAGLFSVAGLVLVSIAASSPTLTSISPSSGSDSVSITSVGGTGFIRGWDKESGLLANWRMDELSGDTVDDVSGNGNNGTSNGAATTTGKLANGRNLDSTTDNINFGDVADISQTSTASIAFWWKGTPTSNRYIIDKYQNSGTYSGYFAFHYDFGSGVKLAWVIGDNDTGGKRTYCASTSSIPTDGAWHHYVIKQTGGTSCANNVSMYFDSVKEQSLTQYDSGSGNSVTSEPLCVGVCGTIGGGAGSAVGAIDELRIYNQALSDDDVTALYTVTGPGSVKLTKTSQSDIVCTGFTYSSSTAMTTGVCDVTGAAAGAWNVQLMNPDGGTGTLSNGFTVPSLPTVTSITPSSSCAGYVVLGVSMGGTNFKRGWDKERCLLGNWRMDETSGLTVADLSGSGFTGTASGTATTTGKLGNARDITGTSDNINFGDVADISQTSAASISFWWKGTPTSNRYIIEKYQDGGGGYFAIHYDYGSGVKLAWLIGEHNTAGKRTYCASTSSIPTAGAWHHYVITQAGGTSCANNISIYFDGVKEQSLTQYDSGTGNAVISEPLCVGVCGTIGGGAGSAVGAIDELRIYNQALSADDVAALYAVTGQGSMKLTKAGQADITCTGLAYSSSTAMAGGVCDVTGAAAGAWNVKLTNPDGGTGTLSNGFTVQ